MAKLTGGGFTNLPPDKAALVDKLIRSEHAFAEERDAPGDDMFMFVLENVDTGDIRGTCQVFSQVGLHQPFYSYKITTLSQTSKALARTFRAEMLTLCTDYEGCSEVGGLFLHPAERAGGLGMLLARSRYMFIRQHRARFADRVLAELRGVIDESGGSPFWDAIAGKFFGMSFREADDFNGAHGTQFIADLMPKTPIYTALISEGARSVMGVPHPSGRAALRMLEAEGFAFDGYVDIFDGGPSVVAQTDQIKTVRDSREETVGAIAEEAQGQTMLLSGGRSGDFAACYGQVYTAADGLVTIDSKAAAMLGLEVGDSFLAARR
jgi:arginine N-succinyltransferase